MQRTRANRNQIILIRMINLVWTHNRRRFLKPLHTYTYEMPEPILSFSRLALHSLAKTKQELGELTRLREFAVSLLLAR